METLRFTYWQDNDHWIGFLEEFPDYWTQGSSLDHLKDHLVDLYHDLSGGAIPGIRRTAELQIG